MDINKIETSHGTIFIKAKNFAEPVKYLSINVATENLLDVKNLLDQNGVTFGLIYGTLLGAYRESNFIKHDYDTDLYVLEEAKQNLLNLLPKLIDIGFQVCRYNGLLLSITRNNEYIDFYFFKKSKVWYRRNDVGLIYKASFLENTMEYSFLGQKFQVPARVEDFLKVLYGPAWRIPLENDQALSHNSYIKIREFIKSKSKIVFNVLSAIKRQFK